MAHSREEGIAVTQITLTHLVSRNSLTMRSLLVQLEVTSCGVDIVDSTINYFCIWLVVLLLDVSNWQSKRACGETLHLQKHTHGQRQESGVQLWSCLRSAQKYCIPVWEGAWRRYIATHFLAWKVRGRAAQDDRHQATSDFFRSSLFAKQPAKRPVQNLSVTHAPASSD